MPLPIKLKEIIEGMDMQSDETTAYLNKQTGEVIPIMEEELRAIEDEDEEQIQEMPDWQKENLQTAKEVLETDNFVALPSKYHINEYSIMEKFCLSIQDNELSNQMYSSIKGSGAFRRFKENIRRHGIEENWYKHRDEAFREIAVDWCKENGITFIEK